MSAKNQRKCLRCNIEMDVGYVTDRSPPDLEKWHEGSPEYNWLGNLKHNKGRHLQIIVFRCPQCAMLEQVAPDPNEFAEGLLTLATSTSGGELTEHTSD